jgi:cytochrome c
MNFLDELVLPQSSHHMELLKYLLVLTYIIFIPYLSLLIGTNLLAVVYNKRASFNSDSAAYRFSKDLIDMLTFNRSVSIGLGVVPLLSAAFCYAQLLHLSPVNVSGYILISMVLFIIGVFFLYGYKNSFQMRDILKAVSKSDDVNSGLQSDIDKISERTEIAYNKFGRYSAIFLLLSAYVFVGAIKLASDSTRWEEVDSILGIIFSFGTIVNFLYFVTASFFATACVVLFYYFRPNNEFAEEHAEVKTKAKRVSLNVGLVSAIALPIYLLVNLFVIPDVGLTGGIFAVFIFIMFVLILASTYFYQMLANGHTKYSGTVVFLLVIFFVLIIIKDQMTFDTSSQKQFIVLVDNYEEYQIQLKEELGIGGIVISGEEIYNGRCIACHQFEQKLVGPAHKDVLPKYDGNLPGLVNYILNPVKVDPNYPPMPAQGLKPAEAQAVAEYIVSVYEEKYK